MIRRRIFAMALWLRNKKSGYLLLITLLAALSFTLGSWSSRQINGVSASPDAKAVLYYYCPMHPTFKSDHSGTAPCCGMELEPAYAGGAAPGGTNAKKKGAIQISSEKQQAIGVRTATVEKTSRDRTLRLLGRVAADELRVYKIRAAVDGWIQQFYPITVGSMVKKGQPLASFYAPEFLGPEQNYIIALMNEDKKLYPDQWKTVQSYEDALRGFGMDALQLEEIRKTRKVSRDIIMRAPVEGFVLLREVYPGYRFLKGEELYRIVQLDRMWVYAEAFENEIRHVRTGATAKVRHPGLGMQFGARVSDVLPQFDAVTRTMKIRLEVDNPDYLLRPDMFVDVELPLHIPPSLTVPAEAIVDSGKQKTVFVDLGEGFFEPRRVETGWRMDQHIQVVKGLMEGEKIVVSGNFLVDSESRIQRLASAYTGNEVLDPVCGMTVDPAKVTSLKSVAGGKTYYFCSRMCKNAFDAEPHKYASESPDAPQSAAAQSGVEVSARSMTAVTPEKDMDKSNPAHERQHGASMNAAKDPVCGMVVDPMQPGAWKSEHAGRTYYFCAKGCKEKFDSDPERYIGTASGH
jgi:membrane fusion protein, copper/silver efflux system